MVDMTAYIDIGQSAQRFSMSDAIKQIVLQPYQDGAFQHFTQALEGKSATVPGGTAVVPTSGKIHDPGSSTIVDSSRYARLLRCFSIR